MRYFMQNICRTFIKLSEPPGDKPSPFPTDSLPFLFHWAAAFFFSRPSAVSSSNLTLARVFCSCIKNCFRKPLGWFSIITANMSPVANATYLMPAPFSQIFSLTYCTWRWNPCLLKKSFCIQARMHLRLEGLCFLPCFCFLFCFSSLLDQYLPIWRSKTFSPFCSPGCQRWLKGVGWGWENKVRVYL